MISRGVKYLFTAAVTALVTASCASTPRPELLSTYESTVGLPFPQSVVDLACLANSFPSKHKKQSDETGSCASRIANDYVEVKDIDGLVYDQADQSFISNSYPSLGVKGFHLKVFERKVTETNMHRKENRSIIFVVV